MTIQETAKIINLIHSSYASDRKATAEDLADRIDAWAVFFVNEPFEVVLRIVKAWIKSSVYMPTIEQIKAAVDIQIKLDQKLAEAGYITAAPLSEEDEATVEGVLEFLNEDY